MLVLLNYRAATAHNSSLLGRTLFMQPNVDNRKRKTIKIAKNRTASTISLQIPVQRQYTPHCAHLENHNFLALTLFYSGKIQFLLDSICVTDMHFLGLPYIVKRV